MSETYVVFPNVSDAEAEHQVLCALYNYPNEETKTYRAFDIITCAEDTRALVLDSGLPLGFRPDLLRKTRQQLKDTGFVFAPRLGE